MAKFKLTPSARKHLDDIWIYTHNVWGEVQADIYIDHLFACIDHIVAEKAAVKSQHMIADGLRSLHCQHHYIFYLDYTPKVIVAILHEKMDMLTRLRSYL